MKKVVVLTGAGISAESGIKTFRDSDGLWENYRVEDVATYVDEIQKKDMSVYDSIFHQAKDRLKRGGFLVLHLGKNNKCDMGTALIQMAKKYFLHTDLFDESVVDCQKFGIRDLGGVTSHEYLVCY